ncbi:hypothetical protein A9G36_02870 [Gilliamella sp. Choc6-1]|nr:hypothetical protein A9G36_02870 [Gilliamella apicola]
MQIIMKSKEESLIYNLLTNKIDLDTFYNEYPVNLKENKNYFYEKLLISIEKQDLNKIEEYLDIEEYLNDNEYIKNNLDKIYKQLIIKDWIPSYFLERLLDSLELNTENRKYFIRILGINNFDKNDTNDIETFIVPIWKKCLWNLYKTGSNDETLNILKRYLESPYEDLSNTAKILIQKIINQH